MEIQVLVHESDRELVCFYLDHKINISRDSDPSTFGNWYMRVQDETGEIVSDDWIDDSSALSLRGAFDVACASAELELPTSWLM
ncbi:hypothetical protein [Photobacterium damselae]|uniref:hypothetical protein n=1 Tax=Photobacterium damselae TaxID=38293 RepID=UPI001F21CF4A|nr:hypothetical protein [Photobacterium damselae]UKA04935.1 hypothetical protein IHC89_22075 [Photobacterium damselae subsp. damselae]